MCRSVKYLLNCEKKVQTLKLSFMKIQRVISRYYLIINKIRSSHYASFEEIREHLAEHDIDISLRTLQRDIQNIRDEFGIEVVYSKLKNGYYIDNQESSDFVYFMKFFEMSVMSGTLTDSFRTIKNSSGFIEFDTVEPIVGIEYISQALFAIKERLKVRIKYQRFSDNEAFEANLAPGLLKEYQKRWYLIAWNIDLEGFRTYSLDRVKSFEITGKNFDSNLIAGIKEKFMHVIGIGFPDSEPELIELSFDKDQGKYVKTLPLHHTQTIISDNEIELRILIKVVPNYELIQKIMSFGDRVIVVKPKWLKSKIAQISKEIIKNNLKNDGFWR